MVLHMPSQNNMTLRVEAMPPRKMNAKPCSFFSNIRDSLLLAYPKCAQMLGFCLSPFQMPNAEECAFSQLVLAVACCGPRVCVCGLGQLLSIISF